MVLRQLGGLCACVALLYVLHHLSTTVRQRATNLSAGKCEATIALLQSASEWLQLEVNWEYFLLCKSFTSANDQASVWLWRDRKQKHSGDMPLVVYAAQVIPPALCSGVTSITMAFEGAEVKGMPALLLQYLPLTLQYAFTGSCILFWVFYDGAKSTYLSHMYREDKYGVVLNYAVLSVLHAIQFLLSALPWNLMGSNARRESLPFFTNALLVSLASVTSLLVCLRIMFFNLIFKQHSTPGTSSHERMHFVPILLLGAISVASAVVLSPYHAIRHAPNAFATCSSKLSLIVLLGLGTKLLGRFKSRFSSGFFALLFRFVVIVLECLLIEETMRLP